MSSFDFNAPADLVPAAGTRKSRAYRRFHTAAEAVHFVMEEMPAALLLGTVLEVNDERFDAEGIRRLYESPEYPLPRK